VFAVDPFNAEVELLTDSSAAAGAVTAESRLYGVVQGDGTGNLYLMYIPVTEIVERDELVLTSGSDRIYPKGLPIGRVVSTQKGQVYQRLLLLPASDFARLDEVSILIGSR
jgi:rod shape-determining protein MreC